MSLGSTMMTYEIDAMGKLSAAGSNCLLMSSACVLR